MNREIRFRGKSLVDIGNIKKGDWVYGGISCDTDRVWIDMPYYGQILVDKDTVGQYTGLHDENGKEIYEGDIIEFSYDVFTGNFDTKVGRGTIEFIGGAFYIKPFEIEGKKIKDTDNEEWFLLYTVNTDTLEVIGNIYDNPELLGGE